MVDSLEPPSVCWMVAAGRGRQCHFREKRNTGRMYSDQVRNQWWMRPEHPACSVSQRRKSGQPTNTTKHLIFEISIAWQIIGNYFTSVNSINWMNEYSLEIVQNKSLFWTLILLIPLDFLATYNVHLRGCFPIITCMQKQPLWLNEV